MGRSRVEATDLPQVPLGLSLPSAKLRFLHARPGWREFYTEAGRGSLSSRSEPLVHWEKLKNKRTRIQIRKARNRGCCGNLQQAPSLALRLSEVGAATCQAQLPLPPRLPPPAQCRSHGHRRGARAQTGPSAPPGGPSRPGLSLPAIERLFLSQSDTSTQRPPECTEPPSPTT